MEHDTLFDDPMLDADIGVPDHVVHRVFDAETVMLNLRTGTYHGLNPTGGRVLELLTGGATLRGAAHTISDEEHHPYDDVARDLVALCQDLVERGLIEIDDGSVR